MSSARDGSFLEHVGNPAWGGCHPTTPSFDTCVEKPWAPGPSELASTSLQALVRPLLYFALYNVGLG